MALLPFLKKSHDSALGGVMTVERKPDGDPQPSDSAMEACAQDILRAIESKDFKHLAAALRAAIDCASNEDPEIGEEGIE